jgi:hypothetical protein
MSRTARRGKGATILTLNIENSPFHVRLGLLWLILATSTQASSGKGNELWAAIHERIQNSAPASRKNFLQTSGLIDQGLVLPMTFPELSPRGHRYEKFVKQIQAENPGAKLTRKIVDLAAQGIIERQCGKKQKAVAILVRQVSPLNTASRCPGLFGIGHGRRVRAVLD